MLACVEPSALERAAQHWIAPRWRGMASGFPRDVSLGEDHSRIRTGHGSANNAALNNLALALLVRSGRGAMVPLAQSHFCACRDEALEAPQAKQ